MYKKDVRKLLAIFSGKNVFDFLVKHAKSMLYGSCEWMPELFFRNILYLNVLASSSFHRYLWIKEFLYFID